MKIFNSVGGAKCSRVFVLYAGGTIGMSACSSVGLEQVSMQSLADFLATIPKLASSYLCNPDNYVGTMGKQLATENKQKQNKQYFIELANHNIIQLVFSSLPRLIDSSEIQPTDWQNIASTIETNYSNYAGFVILHGTDTMAYTASILSFMLINLSKPVVLTGSMRPLAEPKSDALGNLMNAINVAGHEACNLPLLATVMIVFANKIIKGCRSSKIHKNSDDAFASINYPLLGTINKIGTIDSCIKINQELLEPPNTKQPFSVKTKISQQIGIIYFFPGITIDYCKHILLEANNKAVILVTYGNGTLPIKQTHLIDFIKQACLQCKLIVNMPQCANGFVDNNYVNSLTNQVPQVISGMDMTLETTIVKIMWVLAQYKSYAEQMTAMRTNLCGEFSNI